MATIPLPRPRPQIPTNDPVAQPATPASFEALQQRIKQNYGDNKCLIPPQPESLPDDNAAYNLQGFSRESVLDVTIQAIIDNGVDPTFATEFATGAYGIESMYGDSWEGRLYGKEYIGPWQVGTAYMREFGPPGGDKKKIVDQIIAVSNFVPKAQRALRAVSPTGFVEPGWLYIAHQQGLTGAVKAIDAYFRNPSASALSILGTNYLGQAGFGLVNDATHYNALATIKQFVDCEVNIFKQSMARGGSGNCGEYMVRFAPGATLSKGDGVPNFSKAVFDIWFMVTDAQIAAARAQYASIPKDPDDNFLDFNLPGMLPIYMWGPNPVFGGYIDGKCGPSCISVNCGPRGLYDVDSEDNPGPSLVIRLQYDFGVNDITTLSGNHQPDFFQLGHLGAYTCYVAVGAGSPINIPVTPNVLHHLLFSVDMNGTCSASMAGAPGDLAVVEMSSDIKAYVALDDVNYNGAHFWPANPITYVGHGDPQGIISNNTFYISTVDDIPHSATFSGQPLQAIGEPMGIPCAPNESGHLFGLGAAGRVRVWFGESIDTSSEEERRFFIDENGKAADAQLAVDLFGRAPNIQFGAGTDFLTGTNTGTEDDFTVSGTLTKVTGDLKIGTTVA